MLSTFLDSVEFASYICLLTIHFVASAVRNGVPIGPKVLASGDKFQYVVDSYVFDNVKFSLILSISITTFGISSPVSYLA